MIEMHTWSAPNGHKVALRAAAVVLLLGAASPLSAQTVARDPLLQPFSSDSIWNMPIGTGAQYVAINMSGTPGNNAWAGMPQIDDDYIVFKPAAPLTAVNVSNAGWTGKDRCPATGGLLVQVPIPTTFVVPNVLNNNGAVFLMPDNRTIIQTQPFTRCVAGGPATSIIKFGGVDIYGDGRLGGHGGSSLSAPNPSSPMRISACIFRENTRNSKLAGGSGMSLMTPV